MTIQKIFSDVKGEEKFYSVLMSEEELRLFGEVANAVKEISKLTAEDRELWSKILKTGSRRIK